jgi:hypothetical protein
MNGVLFKIDFEKAYDKVNWSFLQQVLRMKGLMINGVSRFKTLLNVVVWESVLMRTLTIIFKRIKD